MKLLIDLIKKKGPILIGVELTAFYLVCFVLLCWLYVDRSKPLTLNEVGDLLAGVFAPLAFLWMVVTIFLQGKELKLQREELALQRKELAKSSEQLARQSDLVEIQYSQSLGLNKFEIIKDRLNEFANVLVNTNFIQKKDRDRICDGKAYAQGFFSYFSLEEPSVPKEIPKTISGPFSKKDNIERVHSIASILLHTDMEYEQADYGEYTAFYEFYEEFCKICKSLEGSGVVFR